MKWLKIIAVSLIGVLPLEAGWAPVWAQAEQDEALKNRKKEGLIPYGRIARQVERQFNGRVVGQNLHQTGGRWVYQLRILKDHDGSVVVVVIDAKTGRVIQTSGR